MPSKKPATSRQNRRQIRIVALFALIFAVIVSALAWRDAHRPGPGPDTVVVYKRATCNCCSKWVTHLKEAGFEVEVHNESNLDARQDALGVPPLLRACHTAVIGGYLVEGHVPALDIRRLLSEKPQARGIGVPGMPIGSPGMEQGDRHDPYATLLFQTDGQSTIFAQHGEAVK